MKALRTLNKSQIQRHILLWALIIAYANITDPLEGTWAAKILGSALININYMMVFYSFGIIIFPLFWVKNKFLLVLSILLCLLLFWTNYYLICHKIIPILGGKTFYQTSTLFYFIKTSFFYFAISASAGMASFFNRYALYKLKAQAEKDSLLMIKELNYLKNQFDSHITFNFLNYCYSKLHIESPEIADSIELFSDMLRYNLKIKSDEKVSLNDEITYLSNYINLQKTLNKEVFIKFSYPDKTNEKYIIPHVLSALVENSFNSILIYDKLHPLLINFTSDNDELYFTIQSKIIPNKMLENSNESLENIQQILDLYYKDSYKLTRKIIDDTYYIDLVLESTSL